MAASAAPLSRGLAPALGGARAVLPWKTKGDALIPKVTFILVPGSGGSPWYWHLVAAKLQHGGYEAVPVALPAADDTAGLPEYAAAVVCAIGRRQPQRVVLVAQSLAGFVAPLVCKQVPVALLVLVNAMIPKPGESPGEW